MKVLQEFDDLRKENAALKARLERAESFLRSALPFIDARTSYLKQNIQDFLVESDTPKGKP